MRKQRKLPARKQRKMKGQIISRMHRKSQKVPFLEEVHNQMLTPFVLRRARSLKPNTRLFFNLWVNCKKVEFLPNGIPYKVSGDHQIKTRGATFVPYFNRPLILVAKYLSPAERQDCAMHEFVEWKNHFGEIWRGQTPAHFFAVKNQNPRLRRNAIRKGERYIAKMR
jgi:hypothetical protein